MRSSKSRSRSKQNRPRTIGNIVNRVFDSSGPEGKVRGTPQQIIEKYQALARDAQLSNDRVAAENFLQHAEHYTRMLGEAMREMAAEQEARRQFQGSNGSNGNGNGHQGGERQPWQQNRRDDRGQEEQPEIGSVPVFPFDDADAGAVDSGLVETPEDRAEMTTAPVVADDYRAEPERRPAPRRDREESGARNPAPREDSRSEGRNDRRSESKRDTRRKDDRRHEERKPARETAPRDVAPVSAVSVADAAPAPAPVPVAAPIAEADAAARPAPKPRRAPSPRKPKATAEAAVAGDDIKG